MKKADLIKQIKAGNRLHSLKIQVRTISPILAIFGTRKGSNRTTLALPSITLDSKGMTPDEAEIIKRAMSLRDEIEASMDTMSLGAVKIRQAKGRTTLADVLDMWVASFTVPQTAKNARQAADKLIEAVGVISSGKLSRSHLIATQEHLTRQDKHPNTIRYHLSRLRAFSNWATEKGYCVPIDTRKLLPPEQFGQIKALSGEELERLARTPCTWPDVKDRFLLGVYTAQRQGEINKYTFRVLLDGAIKVRQGKTGKWIEIPLSASARDLITSVKARRKGNIGPDDLIFSELPAAPTACSVFKAWLKSANVDSSKVTPKNARSTAITLLIKLGASESVTQELANHASPITTARYYRQVDTEHKKTALELISTFGAKPNEQEEVGKLNVAQG